MQARGDRGGDAKKEAYNMNHRTAIPVLIILLLALIGVASADWVYNANGYYTYVIDTQTFVMRNTTGTGTFTMPSGLVDNTIYNIVIVGTGGTGGIGATTGPIGGAGGLGGFGGGAGTVTTQSTYAATGGTSYTLSIPASSSATAFGYSAQNGTPGLAGSGYTGNNNGGNGQSPGSSGYSGYSPLPIASTGSAGASYGYTGGSPSAGGTGFGAGGGAGGGGSSGSAPGGAGGAGASGYITFYYTNTIGTAPTASFTETPGSGPAPLFVQFNDTSTGVAPPTSWLWNSYFQNNGTLLWSSTLQNPSYTYSGGSYSVTMTATNSYGSATAPTQYVSSGNVVLQPALLMHFDGMWT